MVVPICPFFAAYIRNHPEEQDLLEPGYLQILTSKGSDEGIS
jgi:hypothetical protein